MINHFNHPKQCSTPKQPACVDALKSAFAVGLLAIFSLVNVGCSKPKNSASPSDQSVVTADAKLRKVKLLLNWFPEAEHGGYYAAKELGYFAQEGLDVTIVPGGKTTVVAQELTLGRVEFGLGNADDVLVAVQQDAPLLAVMTPMQETPRCILLQEQLGIESFDQIRDVTLLLDSARAFVPYLKHRGYLNDKVTIAPYFGSIAPLATDQRYGCQGYTFSEPFLAAQQGIKITTLNVSDIGYSPYCTLLITNSQLAKREPALVSKAVRASVRGWQSYLEDPDEINRVILAQNSEGMTFDALQYGAKAIVSLSQPPAGQAFGSMTNERWSTLIEQMEQVKFLDSGKIKAESVFSNEFLK